MPVMVFIGIALVVVAVGVIVYGILHPISALRKLTRFVCAILAILCVILGIVSFVNPTPYSWVGSVLFLALGASLVFVYNRVLQPRR